MKKIILFIVVSLFIYSSSAYSESHVAKPEALVTGENSGFYVSDAVFFDAKGNKAIVFVPGFIFNKESWFLLAKPMQAKGVSSLSLSGKSASHVAEAIQLLEDKGYSDISLVGGSSGAVAILDFMETAEVDAIKRVALLSPVKGKALNNKNIEKLYIVSRDEKSYAKVEALFTESEEPKQLEVIAGNQHAQFLFYGDQKDAVKTLLMDYLSK